MVQAAIFGNVGTIITFRVGAADAETMEKEFTPRFTIEDLVNLKKYEVYLKLMIDGAASEPFSANTLAPIAERTESYDRVIKVSRERYASTRKSIEEKVLRWSGLGSADEGVVIDVNEESGEASGGEDTVATAEKIKQLEASSPQIAEHVPTEGAKKKKPAFEIPCSVCGKMQQLTFEPDWSRPWFCKEDLDKRNLAPSTPPPKPLSGPVSAQPTQPQQVQNPTPSAIPQKPLLSSPSSFQKSPLAPSRPLSSPTPAARPSSVPKPPLKIGNEKIASPRLETKPVSLSALLSNSPVRSEREKLPESNRGSQELKKSNDQKGDRRIPQPPLVQKEQKFLKPPSPPSMLPLPEKLGKPLVSEGEPLIPMQQHRPRIVRESEDQQKPIQSPSPQPIPQKIESPKKDEEEKPKSDPSKQKPLKPGEVIKF